MISTATVWFYARAILLTVVLLFGGRWAIGLLQKAVDKLLLRTKLDAGIIKFLRSVVTVLCYALMIYLIAEAFGLPTASFIALFGTIGVTVGLALQGSLSNLAAGIQLLVLRPFRVGDYINAPGVDGVAEEVGLFTTRLKTLDNKEQCVPNTMLTGAVITNFSSLDERRIDFTVNVSYATDLKLAKKVIVDMLNAREGVIRKDDTIVYVDNLDDNAMTLGVRYWVATPDYWTERWAGIEGTKLALDAAGIVIPFDQIDVHIAEAEQKKPAAKKPAAKAPEIKQI